MLAEGVVFGLIQLVISALITGYTKASMENFYRKKERELEDRKILRDKVDSSERASYKTEVARLSGEIVALKGAINQMKEKLALTSEKVAVVISNQERQSSDLSKLEQMMVNFQQNFFGRVVRK